MTHPRTDPPKKKRRASILDLERVPRAPEDDIRLFQGGVRGRVLSKDDIAQQDRLDREELMRSLYHGTVTEHQSLGKTIDDIVGLLVTRGYPRNLKEAKAALKWMLNPNAKAEDMPSQALLLELIAGLVPGFDQLQAGRDAVRPDAGVMEAAFTALAAVPVFGYVKDLDTFVRNAKRIVKAEAYTSGRALGRGINTSERLTGRATVKIGDRVFAGESHAHATMKAREALGDAAVDDFISEYLQTRPREELEGFETYLDGNPKDVIHRAHVPRNEAQAIAERTGQTKTRLPSGNLTSEQIKHAQGRAISPAAERVLVNRAEPVPAPTPRAAVDPADMPQMPLEAKSHLLVPGLSQAPPEYQTVLREEIQSALSGPNGEDLVADMLGLRPGAVDMGTGVWEGSRTPVAIYTYPGLADAQARQLAIAHSVARGQEASAWWRMLREGEEGGTAGLIVSGLTDADFARLAEVAPEFGATHFKEDALFLNFEGAADFEARLTEALTALDPATENRVFEMHGAKFYTEYYGSPTEFQEAFGDDDLYRTMVGSVTEMTAPVYRYMAELTGDVERFNPLYRRYLDDVLPESTLVRQLQRVPADLEKLEALSPDAKDLTAMLFETMPEARVMASQALAGVAKRGWYSSSAQAINQVFGPDTPRFAALLASMSPQTSVESNLENALEVWANWTAAGRPTDPKTIQRILRRSVPQMDAMTATRTSLQKMLARAGDEHGYYTVDPRRMAQTDLDELRLHAMTLPRSIREEISLLDAWRNNATLSLATPQGSLSDIILSGPKVDSFMRNLLGDAERVTADTWMAKLMDVHQSYLRGKPLVGVRDAGAGPGYLALSAKARETADLLTRLTGEVWTPAEVQEAMWSWGYTLGRLNDAHAGEQFADQIGRVTETAIRRTPTFNEQLLAPANARRLERIRQNTPALGVPDVIPMKGGVVPEGGIRPEDLALGAEHLQQYAAKNQTWPRQGTSAGAIVGAGLGGWMLDRLFPPQRESAPE
jgi:hypothetical protein